jgi:hypothetical protein
MYFYCNNAVHLFSVCCSGDGRTLKIFSSDEQLQQQHHQQLLQQQLENAMDLAPAMTASPSAPAFLTKDGQTSSPVLSGRIGEKQVVVVVQGGDKGG